MGKIVYVSVLLCFKELMNLVSWFTTACITTCGLTVPKKLWNFLSTRLMIISANQLAPFHQEKYCSTTSKVRFFAGMFYRWVTRAVKCLAVPAARCQEIPRSSRIFSHKIFSHLGKLYFIYKKGN